MSSAGSAWYVGSFNLCYESGIIMWIVFYVEGCGASSAEYRVHLVCVQSFFVVHNWQNGTRCRDGVNVLWCRSHLV